MNIINFKIKLIILTSIVFFTTIVTTDGGLMTILCVYRGGKQRDYYSDT